MSPRGTFEAKATSQMLSNPCNGLNWAKKLKSSPFSKCRLRYRRFSFRETKKTKPHFDSDMNSKWELWSPFPLGRRSRNESTQIRLVNSEQSGDGGRTKNHWSPWPLIAIWYLIVVFVKWMVFHHDNYYCYLGVFQLREVRRWYTSACTTHYGP